MDKSPLKSYLRIFEYNALEFGHGPSISYSEPLYITQVVHQILSEISICEYN